MTLLSIIIVNYNTGKIFSRAVNAVLKTTNNLKNPSSELLLIDNASTDDSFVVPKAKNVTGIQNKENVGFSKANNQGIKIAKGKYILLLNPDTEVTKESISELLTFAENYPEIGAVGPKLLNRDGSVQPSAFRLPTLWGAIREFWLGKKGIYSKYVPKEGFVDSLVMAALLLTPQALKKVGGLNEDYFMYFEDLDYCRRLKEENLKVYYLPESEVIHYHGVSGKQVSNEENQWRRLVPSSRIYHGTLMHYLINFVIWSGQKSQKILSNKKASMIFLVLFSPVFWWLIANTPIVVSEWQKSSTYFNQKVHSMYSQDNLRYISELRWETDNRSRFMSRLFYNKGTILVDEFFSYLTFLSPRIYFQAGDGSKVSPPGVEPIPAVLFVFWVIGIVRLVRRKSFKPFLLGSFFALLAFLTGQRSLSFLFPLVFINLYIANEGVQTIFVSRRPLVFLLLAIYGGFLIGRAIWLSY